MSLLVKQLLNTAVFVSVLRLSLSSVELWAGQIQTAVCQGVKLAALQSIAGGQDCAQQLEKDPSPSSYTHTLPKYPPVPSLTLPHSQKEQEWFWDTEKRDWHMGTNKMRSLKCCSDWDSFHMVSELLFLMQNVCHCIYWIGQNQDVYIFSKVEVSVISYLNEE